MAYLWLVATVTAALAQSIRHAALKELNRHLSVAATTFSRVLFGLPFLALYLWAVQDWYGTPLPATSDRFWLFIVLTAIGQYSYTALMVRLFQLGNMAVGVMLTKSDVMLTALIGSAFFSERITPFGWVAIALTLAGVLIASAGRFPASAWRSRDAGLATLVFGPAARLGMVCALVGALSYLTLREAILALDPATPPVFRSAYAATIMTVISFALGAIHLLLTERQSMRRVLDWPGLSLVAGLASSVGSAGWFVASSLTNASYVAAVAQVQIVFVMLISRYWFRETIRPMEVVGIVVILAGVLSFRLA